MFRLQTIILTALVAASLPLNAWSFTGWTVELFSDSTCGSSIVLQSSLGQQDCANISGLATSFSFAPDVVKPFALQLFTDLNCESQIFQSATAAQCSPVSGDAAQSFSVSPAPSFEIPGASS